MSSAAPRDQKRQRIARARQKRASGIRSFFLLLVLAGTAGWYFYGQPRDDIASLAAFIDAYPGPAAETPGAATAVVAVEQEPAEAGVQEAAEAGVQEAAAASEAPLQARPEPVPETPDSPAVADSDIDSPGEDDAAADGQRSALIRSFVTVYERDGAARIAFRRPLGTIGTIVWWTADDTAIADRDYIPLEQPVIAFASGEEAETLHVPLINDGLPEPRETFHVYLGQRNPQSGQLEPIARVRVDINDDD